jgi:hypothetical protein
MQRTGRAHLGPPCPPRPRRRNPRSSARTHTPHQVSKQTSRFSVSRSRFCVVHLVPLPLFTSRPTGRDALGAMSIRGGKGAGVARRVSQLAASKGAATPPKGASSSGDEGDGSPLRCARAGFNLPSLVSCPQRLTGRRPPARSETGYSVGESKLSAWERSLVRLHPPVLSTVMQVPDASTRRPGAVQCRALHPSPPHPSPTPRSCSPCSARPAMTRRRPLRCPRSKRRAAPWGAKGGRRRQGEGGWGWGWRGSAGRWGELHPLDPTLLRPLRCAVNGEGVTGGAQGGRRTQGEGEAEGQRRTLGGGGAYPAHPTKTAPLPALQRAGGYPSTLCAPTWGSSGFHASACTWFKCPAVV